MSFNRHSAAAVVLAACATFATGSADDVLAIDYDNNGRTDFVTLNGWGVSGPVKLTAFFPN